MEIVDRKRIHGPINNTLRAEMNDLKNSYPGNMSDFFYTLMLRLTYPKEFQSEYQLLIEPESDSKSIIDISLKNDAAKKWQTINAKFPSIESTIDYLISQQSIQYPGGMEKKIITDIHSMEP